VDSCVNLVVRIVIEVLCTQRFADLVDGFVDEQHAPQNAPFGIQVLRGESKNILCHYATQILSVLISAVRLSVLNVIK
jgi:hypothetical protein